MAYVAFADGRRTWRTADGAFAARRHCRLAGAAHGDMYGPAENPGGTKTVIRYLAIREITAWDGMVMIMEYTAGRWSHMAARHYQKRFKIKDCRRASGNISLRRAGGMRRFS